MNTMYRKQFTGTVDEWVKRCKELHPKGVQEFFGTITLWVVDGIDVGCYNHGFMMITCWIKEPFNA